MFLLILAGCGGGHYTKSEGNILRMFLSLNDAKEVYFASSLDGFELHKANKTNDKTWEIRILANSEFKYFYVVDGSVYVPACRMTEEDDFGSENCVYVPGM